jgi:4-hydroxybenzoate polyprenyltransferase
MDRILVGAMQLMVLGGLALTGHMLLLQWPFWLALAGAAGLFGWQQWLIRHRERDACFKAFLNNNWVGLLVLAGIIAG